MTHDPSTFAQPHFRFRPLDTGILLNDDEPGDWEALIDVDVTMDCHHRLRLRIEVEETATGSDNTAFKMQISKNSGTYADAAFYPLADPSLATDTPVVWIGESDAYADLDATSNILSGSSRTFVAGHGNEDPLTQSFSLSNEHTEFEFVIAIPKFWAEPTGPNDPQNVDGDTFDFRMVESDGTVFAGTYVIPRITLNIPANEVGGVMVETGNFTGIFSDSNGNMYKVHENAESATSPGDQGMHMMLRSDDNGVTWEEMDGDNRPGDNDLEAIDIKQRGTVLHVAHHPGGQINYSTFNTSDAGANPDTWQLKEQNIVTMLGSPALQACTLEIYEDGAAEGDVMLFYTDHDGTNERNRYIRRNGTWSGATTIDTTASNNCMGISTVKESSGSGELIHIFYKEDLGHNLWHKDLQEDGTLSGRDQITADMHQSGEMSFQPCPVVYQDGSVEVVGVVYAKDTDEVLYCTRYRDNVVQSEETVSDQAVEVHPGGGPGHHQPTGFTTVDPATKTMYVRYADKTTMELWETSSVDEGAWTTDVLEINDKITFCRGRVINRGGSRYIAYIYEAPNTSGVFGANAGGYTGGQHYAEIDITPVTGRLPRHGFTNFQTPGIV